MNARADLSVKSAHPLRLWMIINKLSVMDVAARLRKAGHKTSHKYLFHILSGFRRPSYELAKHLSQITGGTVAVDDFMEYKKPSIKCSKAA